MFGFPRAWLMPHADSVKSAKIITHINHEVSLHLEYCRGFGISKEEMFNTEEHEGMPGHP